MTHREMTLKPLQNPRNTRAKKNKMKEHNDNLLPAEGRLSDHKISHRKLFSSLRSKHKNVFKRKK
jgi:hypothetical protein